MKRATQIAVLVCLTVLAGLTAGTIQIVGAERSMAVAEFTAERLGAVEAVAREMDKDLESIGDVLRFAGELFTGAGNTSDRERELGALVRVVKPYLGVLVFDGQGRRVFETAARGAAPLSPALEAEIRAVARNALALQPGQLEASSPFTIDNAAWFRVFATPFTASDGGRAVVALLVDTQPFFGKARLIVSEPEARLLVLGAHGMPVPASAPALARAVTSNAGDLHGFARLVAAMRAGASGTVRLDEREARALGLAGADLVAAYAPVPFPGGHWSIATLSSTLPLRAYERAIVMRLGIAGGALALCIVLFSTYAILATRRSMAMRERLRHAKRVAHLHEMTEKILDNIPTGVLALSAEGRISIINRALRERLADPAVGGTLDQAFPEAPPAVMASLRALIDSALADGRVHSRHGERMALHGKEGQYSLHAVPLEPSVSDAQVLLVVEDLSELGALESRLLRAEKLATVGVLAAGIAHEIGTPLGVVRGRSEYILGKLPDDSPHAPGMRVIIDEIDRVTRTIRQLLDFSRFKPALVRSCAVEPAVRAVVELLRFEADRRKVTLTVSIPGPVPPVAADPDQLQQVLVNLTMNACDAADAGGHVEIGAVVEGATARLEVVDDGCGIPLEHRHQVFDPFFTTKKRGQGTGLGLAVTAQIVRNHGGEIELASEIGAGTRATVRWPLAAASVAVTTERHEVHGNSAST